VKFRKTLRDAQYMELLHRFRHELGWPVVLKSLKSTFIPEILFGSKC